VELIVSNQTGNVWGGGKNNFGLVSQLLTLEGYVSCGMGSTGTFNSGGYFNTQYFADPEEQNIGNMMNQTWGNSGDNTGWKFRQLVFLEPDDQVASR
jgi:hypothetical protein